MIAATMARTLGERLIARRWWIIAVWVAAVTALGVFIKPVDPAANELTTFLPEDSPSIQAITALEKYFPGSSGMSQAVVVMARVSPAAEEGAPASRGAGLSSQPSTAPATADAGRLTAADLAAMAELARRLRQPLPPVLARDLSCSTLAVRCPTDLPAILKPNPMLSQDGAAAITIISIPAYYVTIRSSLAVDYIRRAIAQADWSAGLKIAVTGSAAFGKDYATAAKESHRRSMGVTIAAVLLILLLVYRAPLAAAAVLGTISLAAVTAHLLLDTATHFGLHFGTAEMIFVLVLLYGAGVDYSLLYFSRFRECLPQGADPQLAAGRAWSLSAPTILASAGTVIAGLLMLSAADYKVFKTTGKAVALALAVALAASLTLMPAVAAVLHRRLFWPTHRAGAIGAGRFWKFVADVVTGRPVFVFLACLMLLAVPLTHSLRQDYSYDPLAGLSTRYEAVRGINLARQHWPVGQITPSILLLEASSPEARKQLPDLAARVSEDLTNSATVADVRSLSQPVGKAGKNPVTRLALAMLGAEVRAEYLSADGSATRLVLVIDKPPYSNAAMANLTQLRQKVQKLLPEGVSLRLAGATAEMTDVRRVTQRDFYRVAGLTLAVVFLVVLALLRDPILSGFMVASTVLSYLATLGATWWFFTTTTGMGGLDWKVEVFLFVIMVAVGQDYNIFLAGRLAEESRLLPARAAARIAVRQTGGIISSAGVIMAATLGSLAAGDLVLLVQLGFAFALGMMVDTFLVRPLLLPAFAVLTGRTGHALSGRH